ncbi:MAG: helix-turn-helix domain-containing protein [Clostridia bacterium]|nr:helix-turn-helix domain-containing protein [Clostridia bacterium]
MYSKTPPIKIEDRWLTVSELSNELKISQSTIRRRIKDNTIKALKLFGIVRIPMSQFYETN